MMTRAPIMVTMSEGLRHIASFKNETKEYNLDSENELLELRNEIEKRMLTSVKSGKSITSETISLTMSGQGLPRMVLVDLPGIINTVTSDLSPDSKDSIILLAKSYMSNPNSIILCIQDGSVDAERSLVTDLVTSIDPSGARTICVLTKLDVAERNKVKMERIQRLLSGKLFPMKALNYFAVIAGTGNPDSSIDDIAKYENDFFKKSTLFKDGTIKPSQATSENLIHSVSECFWNMVKNSVEHELDTFRSKHFALQAEWKHNFPNMRELDREELFEKARTDILEDTIKFCHISSKEWEKSLSNALFKSVMSFVFRDIYLKNALTSSKIAFQTQVDILSEQWLETVLTQQTIEVAKGIMFDKINEIFSSPHSQYSCNAYKDLFKPIRDALYEECINGYKWSENGFKNLQIIQKTALLDESVTERSDWDQACSFMENVVLDNERQVTQSLSKLLGPSSVSQWFSWTSLTPEQQTTNKIFTEITNLMKHREANIPNLNPNETLAIIHALANQGYSVKPDMIHNIFDNIFLLNFYQNTIGEIHNCRKYFRSNDFSRHPLGCNDIVLFHKIHKLLQQSVNSLRQQIISHEARRLENYIKDILDDYSIDEAKKKQLLTGKQVELAVEIKKISDVQAHLETFIASLLREKDL